MTTYAVVGKPVTREDGPEKVSGRTCYAGDLRLPGMLWGKVLRSPLPHARIVRIDTAGALQLPVFSAQYPPGHAPGKGLQSLVGAPLPGDVRGRSGH